MFRYKHIAPLCLPDPGVDVDENVTAIVAGWGLTGKSGWQSDVLKKTDVKTWSNERCQSQFGFDPDGILDTHLCAYKRGSHDFKPANPDQG